MTQPIVAELRAAGKQYLSGQVQITALHPTDLQFRAGELTLLIGPSGSGKTTLLSLLGCVIYPSQGEVVLGGVSTAGMSDDALAALRLRQIGFVFQNYNLIAPYNALENVMLPLQLQGYTRKQAKEKALHALATVQLSDRLYNLPSMLSGGQQQRVCIARALVTDPPLVLCDEPTAALDQGSVGIVMDELQALARAGKSVVIVTHDHRLKAYADRIVYVDNGRASEVPPTSSLL